MNEVNERQLELEEVEEGKHALCSQLHQLTAQAEMEKEKCMVDVWMSLADGLNSS